MDCAHNCCRWLLSGRLKRYFPPSLLYRCLYGTTSVYHYDVSLARHRYHSNAALAAIRFIEAIIQCPDVVIAGFQVFSLLLPYVRLLWHREDDVCALLERTEHSEVGRKHGCANVKSIAGHKRKEVGVSAVR